MITASRTAAAICAALLASGAQADATLTYELSSPDGEKTVKTFSVSRFFARVEDSTDPDSFLLFQAGKFFPLYRVDVAAKTYTRLTPEVKASLGPAGRGKGSAQGAQPQAPAADTPPAGDEEPEPQEPAAGTASAGPETVSTKNADSTPPPGTEPEAQVPKASGDDAEAEAAVPMQDSEPATSEASTIAAPEPELRPTAKTKTVGGVRCRVIQEVEGEQRIREHCMANKARLGITEREIRTLARTFVMARKRSLGWLGAATKDEDFVSVATRDLNTNRMLELRKVSTDPLPAGHLRVPREFKQVQPEAPSAPGAEKAGEPAG
jgi:hypothetical protein